MGAVAAYMEYLREMARKIAYRGSFLKVIPGTRSMPSRYMDWDQPHSSEDMQRFLLGAEQDKQAKDGRALFLGVGLCMGKTKGKNRIVNVAAPLLLVPMNIEPDDDGGGGLALDAHWRSIALNYDLITTIVEGGDTVDEEDAMGQPNMLSPAAARAVHDVEHRLDTVVQRMGYTQEIQEPRFAEEIIDLLMTAVPAFRGKVIKAPGAYQKEELNRYERSDQLLWFNKRFLFMGNNPGELSAYEALNELCSIIPNEA
jgi:hypothetical protein